MIPRRANGIDASIPVGTGQLPTIPDKALAAAVTLDDVTIPAGSNILLSASLSENKTSLYPLIMEGLQVFQKACKKTSVSENVIRILIERKLIVQSGDYCVTSEKGLTYLIDFGIL